MTDVIATLPIKLPQDLDSPRDGRCQWYTLPLTCVFSSGKASYSFDLAQLQSKGFFNHVRGVFFDTQLLGANAVLGIASTIQTLNFPQGVQGYAALLCADNAPVITISSSIAEAGSAIVHLLNFRPRNQLWTP